MTLPGMLAIGIPFLLGGAAAAAYLNYRVAMNEAKRAFGAVAAQAAAPTERFDPAMVADQPEIARRYFNHAIAPGTALASVVELEMRGTFLLGDKRKHQTYAMKARQVLRPPFEFVWMPVLTSGPMRITGSDVLANGEASTRFWLMGLVPVANAGTSPDMLRSATFRAAMEGVWLPASLLPARGVRWEQTGENSARVTITRTTPPIIVDLELAADGAIERLVGQRWSNANPEQRFRLQPFGGTVEGEATFRGFTVPARLNVGNHFGTPDYLPFFQAEVVSASYR